MRSRFPHSARRQPVPSWLENLGWRAWLDERLPDSTTAFQSLGRVTTVQRDRARVAMEQGDVDARVHSSPGSTLPAVGDWVLLSKPDRDGRWINQVLPRRTSFSRKVAGDVTAEQVVATNIDTVFVVEPCSTFNPRRLERALVAIWASGAQPVVILSKADLVLDVPWVDAERVSGGVRVHAISVIEESGLQPLEAYCQPGETVALIGPSGAGKSTLVNRLVGSDVAKTGDVRASDGRGRHTTTHRELIRLPAGGLLIDTPGLRELQLWDARDGFSQAFEDVETLASACRFRDCQHESEGGCAVLAAIESGELDPRRLESYRKLNREIVHFESRFDQRIKTQTKHRDKLIHRQMRDYHPRE